MLTEISGKELEFLRNEVSVWTDDGVITSEQAENILSLYAVKSRNLRHIMVIAGIILVCLGVISLILAHWSELNKSLRVGIITLSYAGSMTAYIMTRKKYFVLLSSSIFGGGMYLILQMYEIDATFSEFLMIWICETVITTMITRSEWQVYMSQVLSLMWLIEADAVNIFPLYFMNAAEAPLTEFFMPLSGFALIAVMWLLWMNVQDRTAMMIDMMLTLLLFSSRMSICFGGTWTLIMLSVTGCALSFAEKYDDVEIFGLMMLGACGLILTWPEMWRGSEFASYRNILPVMNACIVGSLMVVNIYRGHTGIGVIFFGLMASRYFFDHIFGFLPKAYGFTITGIIFVAAGLILGHVRKQKP